ncbi:hypothetical protein ON010_g17763 [Phytophthora cinnamomi]|nr:hypothetical protein ON010_g17763 [Phytophthora cinnamomi]
MQHETEFTLAYRMESHALTSFYLQLLNGPMRKAVDEATAAARSCAGRSHQAQRLHLGRHVCGGQPRAPATVRAEAHRLQRPQQNDQVATRALQVGGEQLPDLLGAARATTSTLL